MSYGFPLRFFGPSFFNGTYLPTAFTNIYYLPPRYYVYSTQGGYSEYNHYCLFYNNYGCSVWSGEFDSGHLSMIGWDFSKRCVILEIYSFIFILVF